MVTEMHPGIVHVEKTNLERVGGEVLCAMLLFRPSFEDC